MTGIPTVVAGRSGRMARLVAQAVRDTPGLRLAGILALRPGAEPADGVVTALDQVPGPPPVVVDFTTREATAALLRQALTTPCALVIGTSGLTDPDRELLHRVGKVRAVVQAANFSLGLLQVARLARRLAAETDPSWRAGVIDVHFAGKRDAPSGTATHLAEQWSGAREADDDVPVASFRIGDGVSEHRFLAAGPAEHLEVVHRVDDRRAFLPGVVRAVRFVHRAAAGVYPLDDILEGDR